VGVSFQRASQLLSPFKELKRYTYSNSEGDDKNNMANMIPGFF
jgi:hypothetical protein